MTNRLITLAALAVMAGCGVSGTQGLEKPQVEAELKKHKIEAYVASDLNEGVFSVNDDSFSLPSGGTYNLGYGVQLFFVGGLVQSYAGGVNQAKFSLQGACPLEMVIKSGYVHGVPGEGEFEVNGEGFVLGFGETQVLQDGSKITLKNQLNQNYAGGLHGLEFDLDC